MGWKGEATTGGGGEERGTPEPADSQWARNGETRPPLRLGGGLAQPRAALPHAGDEAPTVTTVLAGTQRLISRERQP